MGAPGEYVLCGYGHVIGVIEDDLYWGEPEDEDSVHKEAERLENNRCIKCGRIAKYRICHYGDINDCIAKNSKLEWNSKENRYIIPDNVNPNLNLNIKSLPGLNDELVTSLIERLRQSGLKIIHKSQIGEIELSEVSDEYFINLIMNR